MPSLNFKKQFAPAVLNGTKHQTIRATRKRPIKVGDRLYLYTGMRTKACYRLRVTACMKVSSILIDIVQVSINGRRLNGPEMESLAKADGFSDSIEFLFFFRDTHGLPFTGQLIEWAP